MRSRPLSPAPHAAPWGSRCGARALVLIALATAATGCSVPTPQSWNGSVSPAIINALTALDVGQEPQRPVLDAAAHEMRDVTLEEYQAAIGATEQCLSDAGFTATVTWTTVGLSQMASFTADVSAGKRAEYDATFERCDDANSNLIEFAYSRRAEVVAWEDRLYARYRGDMLACAREKGLDVPADATVPVILQADASSPASEGSPTCAATTGLQAELGVSA